MKHLFVKGMALALALALMTSCGSANQPAASTSTAASSEIVEPQTGGTTLTQENILDYPETPMEELRYEEYDGQLWIEGCESEAEVLVIPAEYNGLPVVGIGAHALAGLGVRAIVLPDSIVRVDEDAFGFNEAMEYVHLGTGLKELGNLAFGGCKNLKQIIIPEGAETIDGPLLINNDQLERLVIPATVVNLPDSLGVADTCPKTVVVVPEGSAAEQIAVNSGFKVEHS